jgi:hypothetical protein
MRCDRVRALLLRCTCAVARAAGGSASLTRRRTARDCPDLTVHMEGTAVVDAAFVLLTVALFALLALVLRGVERL